MKRLRYLFWAWAHRKAEALWHWIYYRKLQPLEIPIALKTEYHFCESHYDGKGNRVDIYRSSG